MRTGSESREVSCVVLVDPLYVAALDGESNYVARPAEWNVVKSHDVLVDQRNISGLNTNHMLTDFNTFPQNEK